MSKSRSLYQVRRRWSAEDARAALSALAASGLSARAFAEREGLEVQRLLRWRRVLGADGVAPPAPAFVELERAPMDLVEVVVRSGRVLRVPASIAATDLRRLVEALEC
jgi:hypothetical protein